MRTSKKHFDKALDALDALRGAPGTPETVAALRKALSNRSNYLVAKAARIAGEQALSQLMPELLAALDSFFEASAKTDAQCWAKSAIFKALHELGCDDPDVFLRGLTYIQMEPVWGGEQDTAGAVRAQCAAALVGCRSIPDAVVLRHLVELLADPDKSVRAEAARAVGRIPRSESSLLLRLRALIGDEEAEVTAACFKALLEIDGLDAIPFVAKFLGRGGEAAEEAALALGETHSHEGLTALKEFWENGRDRSSEKVVIASIALTRLEEGIRFLAEIVRTGSLEAARHAMQAVTDARVSAELKEMFTAAVRDRGDPQLFAAWKNDR